MNGGTGNERKSRLGWLRGLVAALAIGIVHTAQALGLGPIEVRSALNEPLDAVIPLTRVTPEELEDLTVSLAPLETFQQLGLEITPALRQLRFRLREDERGGWYVQVTSSGPVKEPFLSFVVALEWPKGRLLREYTVLLDPPLFTDEQAPPARGEGGAGEDIPPLPELAPVEGAVAGSAPSETGAPGEAEGEFRYGPIRPGETLSTIAQRVRPAEVTLEQMMIALYRANPDAFLGNINLLKAGSILRLQEDPRSAAARIAPDDAVAEVMRQYRLWQARQRGEGGQPALVSAEGGGPGAGAAVGVAQARLELVAPEAGSESSAGGAGDALRQRVEELERRLALAAETAAAAERENEHLAERVSALEEQVAALQRLVALRDEQLARLSAQLESALPSGQEQRLALGEGERSFTPAQSPPKPARPVQPDLWQDPLVLAGLVGGGSLILLGAWFLWYRRRSAEDDDEWRQSLLQEALQPPAETAARSAPAAAAAEDVPSVPSVPEPPAQRQGEGDLAATGEIDPLAEADVYLAYGDYEQAKAVVEAGLKDAPQRHDLLLKRLEIAHNQRDVDGFCHYAEAMLEALGGDTDHPEWAKVRTLGEDLVPDHPWFREHTQLVDSMVAPETLAAARAEGEASPPPAPADERAPDSAPLENPDEVTLFAEDSELRSPAPPEAMEEGEPSPEEIDRAAESEPSAFEEEADARAPDGGPDSRPGGEGDGLRLAPLDEGPAPTQEAAEPQFEVSSELDLEPLESVEPEGQEAAAPAASPEETAEPHAAGEAQAEARPRPAKEAPSQTEEEFDGNAFFVFTDEVGTKLDLARAYIEMGDKAGARELLEEVMDIGDEAQQAEAQELLRQIA